MPPAAEACFEVYNPIRDRGNWQPQYEKMLANSVRRLREITGNE